MSLTEEQKGLLLSLNKLERLILDYFITNISVGEIIAVIELRELVKRKYKMGERDLVSEPDDAIIEREITAELAYLVRKSILSYGNGAYSLSPWLREVLKKKFGKLSPGKSKPLEELLKA